MRGVKLNSYRRQEVTLFLRYCMFQVDFCGFHHSLGYVETLRWDCLLTMIHQSPASSCCTSTPANESWWVCFHVACGTASGSSVWETLISSGGNIVCKNCPQPTVAPREQNDFIHELLQHRSVISNIKIKEFLMYHLCNICTEKNDKILYSDLLWKRGGHFWTALISQYASQDKAFLHLPFIPPTSANLEETPVSCLEQKKHVTVEIYQELSHWRLFSTLNMTPNKGVNLSF